MNIFSENWLAKSLLSMLLIISAWLAVTFFNRNFQVRGETFFMIYSLGSIIGIAMMVRPKDLTASIPNIAIFIFGFTIGTAINFLLFSAIPQAPAGNAALPVAIQSSAIIFVYLGAYVLHLASPKYFGPIQIDIRYFYGMLLVLAGQFVIAWSKK